MLRACGRSATYSKRSLSRRTSRRRPARLFLERLEDRTVPSFLAAATYPTGPEPTAVAVADLNGDGLPDLATANFDSNDVSVLLNQGGGTLGAAQGYAAGALPHGIAAADFTGDHVIDLVTANNQGGDLSLLRGDGD